MSLTDEQILDIGVSTLADLGKARFNLIATSFTDYEFAQRIMKKDKVQFGSGQGIARTLMFRHSGAAKHVGMNEPDAVSVGPVLSKLTVDWRHTTTNWAWERREMLMNRGSSEIVNLMKVRRTDGLISMIELLEDAWWSKPDDSSDEITPYGLKMYLVPGAEATSGFVGKNPAGFSGGFGGIDSDTESRWRNYYDEWTSSSKEDQILGMRKLYRETMFKNPIGINDFRNGKGQRYRVYCNLETISDLELIGEAQNDNLGRDLASMDGTMTFRGNPVIYVPQLNSDTRQTMYFVCFDYLAPVFLKGDYLRESSPRISPRQHNTFEVFQDCTGNLLCTDRRRQGVMRKSA